MEEYRIEERQKAEILYMCVAGRGSLVVKVTELRSACHELEPNADEDPPCRVRLLHVKSVEAQTSSSWCGVAWKLEEGMPPQLITCIFNVKDTPRTVVENVGKITEIIEVDWHVSSRSIAQELKSDHKTVLNHLLKVGFKKRLDVWVPHNVTPKNIMDRISIYETLAKRNGIDPFFKRMVTRDEKGVTYDNIVRKRSWSKRGEAVQTMAKPGLTAGRFYCVFGGIGDESFIMSCFRRAKH
ncbi:histone-lysine N-methyltransferase SETMAR [Trichonephila clavipes]|nr:histone-lysine N-methyltransferase SETMAR [Trichonephila clavipes]